MYRIHVKGDDFSLKVLHTLIGSQVTSVACGPLVPYLFMGAVDLLSRFSNDLI